MAASKYPLPQHTLAYLSFFVHVLTAGTAPIFLSVDAMYPAARRVMESLSPTHIATGTEPGESLDLSAVAFLGGGASGARVCWVPFCARTALMLGCLGWTRKIRRALRMDGVVMVDGVWRCLTYLSDGHVEVGLVELSVVVKVRWRRASLRRPNLPKPLAIPLAPSSRSHLPRNRPLFPSHQ